MCPTNQTFEIQFEHSSQISSSTTGFVYKTYQIEQLRASKNSSNCFPYVRCFDLAPF